MLFLKQYFPVISNLIDSSIHSFGEEKFGLSVVALLTSGVFYYRLKKKYKSSLSSLPIGREGC